MARNTTLDAILASGRAQAAYRILTVDVDWPTGDPPFAAGDHVSVPWPLPASPPAYDRTTFNPAVWTDCTNLAQRMTYDNSFDHMSAVLSLSIYHTTPVATPFYPALWHAEDVVTAFENMRAIALQHRVWNGEDDTGWITRGIFLSTGFTEAWNAEEAAAVWTVNALDVTMLLNLDVLGSSTGSAVFQADLIQLGTAENDGHYELVMVDDTPSDAWEYAITSDGTPTGPIHPNIADRPGPQFWITNVPDETNPVPIAIGGDAVQCVFGEGKVRIGKAWARTDPGDPPDYKVGLGFDPVTGEPALEGYLFRFAHAEIENLGQTVPSDIETGLVITHAYPGVVHVAGDHTDTPIGLTIILQDGTGGRYKTTAHTFVGGETVYSLADTSLILPVGATFQYGDAGLATDLVTHLLNDSGFQVAHAGEPFYMDTPEQPTLRGEAGETALDIHLPPLVYDEMDRMTPQLALEELRRSYAVLPSWLTRATANGVVETINVRQLMDTVVGSNANILPLEQIANIAVDSTDLNVATKVIVRGRSRQVVDLTQATCTITDVAAASGGLPALTFLSHDPSSYSFTMPDSSTMYLWGIMQRANPGPAHWDEYFALNRLKTRGLATSTDQWNLRPFGWLYANYWGGSSHNVPYSVIEGLWMGKALCEFDFGSEVQIDRIEMDCSNTWYTDFSGWQADYNPSSGSWIAQDPIPQSLAWQYWDGSSWLPLVSGIVCPIEAPAKVSVSAENDFASRAPVTTQKIRLICEQPFSCVWYTTPLHSLTNAIVAVYVNQVYVWSTGNVRGVAEMGVTPPFDTAEWVAIRARMRRRTYVVPDVVDWAQTTDIANMLALEWLSEFTRNLAPRSVVTFRPDAFPGDTVRMMRPVGRVVEYGDGAEQLDDWRIYGLQAARSDDGVLYWGLTWASANPTVTLYRDSAMTIPVASGTRVGNGQVALAQIGESRITGTVVVTADTPPANDTGVIGIPTYLVSAITSEGQGGQLGFDRLTVVSYSDPYYE